MSETSRVKQRESYRTAHRESPARDDQAKLQNFRVRAWAKELGFDREGLI